MHTGANNIPRDGTDQVLEKLEDLCGKILHANPRYVSILMNVHMLNIFCIVNDLITFIIVFSSGNVTLKFSYL